MKTKCIAEYTTEYKSHIDYIFCCTVSESQHEFCFCSSLEL